MHSSSNSIYKGTVIRNPLAAATTTKTTTTTTKANPIITSTTATTSSFSSSSSSSKTLRKNSGGGISTRKCSGGVGKFEINLSGYGVAARSGVGGENNKDYIYLNTKGICLLCYEECAPITIEEKRKVHLQTSINFCRLISRYLDFDLETVIASPLKNVGKRWAANIGLDGKGFGEPAKKQNYDKVAFELCDRCVNLAHAFNQVHFQVQFHQMILDRCVRSISEIIKNANKKSVNELFVLSEDDEAIRTQQKTFTRLTLGGLRSANRLRTKLYKKGLAKLSRSYPIIKLTRVSEELISKNKKAGIKKEVSEKGKIILAPQQSILSLPKSSSLKPNSREVILASFLGCIVSFWIVISLSFINLDELVINIKKEKEIELKLERDIDNMDIDFKYQVPNHLPPPPPVYHPPPPPPPINGTAEAKPKKKRTYNRKKEPTEKGAGDEEQQQPKKRKRPSKAKSQQFDVVVIQHESQTTSSVLPSSSPLPSIIPPFSPQINNKKAKKDNKTEKKPVNEKEKKEKKEKEPRKRKPKAPPVVPSPNHIGTSSSTPPIQSPHSLQMQGSSAQQNSQRPQAFTNQAQHSPMSAPLPPHSSIQQNGQRQFLSNSSAQYSSPSVSPFSQQQQQHPPTNQLPPQMSQNHQPRPSPSHLQQSINQQPSTSQQQMHQYNYAPMSNHQNQYVPVPPPQQQSQQAQQPPQQYYSAASAPVPSSSSSISNSYQQQSYYAPPPVSTAPAIPSNTMLSQPNSQHQQQQQQTQLPYNGTTSYTAENVNMGVTNYNYSYNVSNVSSYNYSGSLTGTVQPATSSTTATSTWIPNFSSSTNDPNRSSTFSSSLPPLQTSTYSFSSITGGGGGGAAAPAQDSSQIMYHNYNNYGNATNTTQQDVNSGNTNAISGTSGDLTNNGSNNSNTPTPTPINTAIYAYDGYGNYVLQHQETSYPPQYSSEPAPVVQNTNPPAGNVPSSTSSSSYFSSLLPPMSDAGGNSSSLFNSALDFDLDASFGSVMEEPPPSLTYEEPPPQLYDKEVEEQQSHEESSKSSSAADTMEGDVDGDGASDGGGKLKSISVFPEVHWRQQQSNATSLKISCTHSGCVEQFITHAQLQLHLRAHGNFKCPSCHMSFGKAHNLALHEKSKHSKKGKCPRCEHHLTPSTFKFLLHFINDHLNISVHDKPCEICNKTFVFGTKAVNRKLHFKKYHDVAGKDPTTISTCKACNAQFLKESQLKDHQSHCSAATNAGTSGGGGEIRTPSASSAQSTSTTTTEEITYNTALATAEQVVS